VGGEHEHEARDWVGLEDGDFFFIMHFLAVFTKIRRFLDHFGN
jgi:hypothetical protein